MKRKDAKVSFKCSPEDREAYENEALKLGFSFNSGKANFSKYIRWILENGTKPIDRSEYKNLKEINSNLARLGGAF